MKKGIELWSINKWLRKIGLVIVIEHPETPEAEDQVTRVWIERSKTFDNRCKMVIEND